MSKVRETEEGEGVEVVCESLKGTSIEAGDSRGPEAEDSQAVADKKKWLQEVFKKKDSPTKKSTSDVEPGNTLVSSRAKWLQEEKRHSPVKKPDTEVDPGHDLVSSRMKWLQEEAGKAGDSPKKSGPVDVVGVSAQERAKWLQEQAFKESEEEFEDAKETEIGSELVAERLKRLTEQGEAKEQVKKSYNVTEISGVSAQDRAKWLQEQAFSAADEGENGTAEGPADNGLVSDRMKWLAGQGKAKEEEVKKSYDATEVSGVSAQDRAKWLQEQAFREAQDSKAKYTEEVAVGNELVAERLKRLAEQGEAKEEVKKSYDVAEVSGVSAQDRAKWLQEQAFREEQDNKAKDTEEVAIGNELVADRLKRLAEQGEAKEEVKKSYDAAEVSGVSAQDRAKWLQEQAFCEAQDKEAASAEVPVENWLVSDRMKWLAEQGKAKGDEVKKSVDVKEISGVSAQDRAKWLQEQAFCEAQNDQAGDDAEVPVENWLVSDRIKGLAVQGKAKEEMKKSFDAEEASGVSAQDRAKWLQEQAFCEAVVKKTEGTEEAAISNELVADRLKRLAERGSKEQGEEVQKSYDATKVSGVNAQDRAKWLQEQAFSQAEEEKVVGAAKPDSKATSGISQAVSAFGGAAKKKSAVQQRLEALEKKEKDMKKKEDPHANMKISWASQGPGTGKFKKTMTDKRGVAPKKSLKDLP